MPARSKAAGPLEPPPAERAARLALEIDDDEVLAGPEHLPEMEVAVTADPEGLGRAGAHRRRRSMISSSRSSTCRRRRGQVLGRDVTEDLAGQAPGAVEEGLPVLRGQRLGGEVRVVRADVRATWSSAVRRPSSDAHSRCGPTRGWRRLELPRSVSPPRRRRRARELGVVGRRRPARPRGRARGRRRRSASRRPRWARTPRAPPRSPAPIRCSPAPVLDAAADPGGVGEPGPLAQEAPELDPRVDALLEAADELHDGLVAQQDRGVGLLARDGCGGAVGAQAAVELAQAGGGEADHLPVATRQRPAAGQDVRHGGDEGVRVHAVDEDTLAGGGAQIGHDGVGVPLPHVLGLGPSTKASGTR